MMNALLIAAVVCFAVEFVRSRSLVPAGLAFFVGAFLWAALR